MKIKYHFNHLLTEIKILSTQESNMVNNTTQSCPGINPSNHSQIKKMLSGRFILGHLTFSLAHYMFAYILLSLRCSPHPITRLLPLPPSCFITESAFTLLLPSAPISNSFCFTHTNPATSTTISSTSSF